jgi:hypothetical protein
VGVADVEDGLVGQRVDGGVQVDAEAVGVQLGELLSGRGSTFTKVVLPVPDIPIAIMHTLLLVLITIIPLIEVHDMLAEDYTFLCCSAPQGKRSDTADTREAQQ